MSKEWYAGQLRHGSWAERKLEIMKRDSFSCCRCGSKYKLQVHHRQYLKRRQVWEYPDKDLETLCDPCHFREHFNKPIAPAKQWEGLEIREEDPVQTKILHLQEKLKEPLSDELQEQILMKIMELRKGAKNG